jgi:8-oxo-dGTP pyrophosphatase MutT (NUDIX family)
VERPSRIGVQIVSAGRVSYGGVVFDVEGRVLLREPRNHFGNAVWTFPKGKPDDNEDSESTALRETLEETGVGCCVVARIPGSYCGSTGYTEYYLMCPDGTYQPPGDETWSVRWAPPEEARRLIAQTPSEVVRKRDLDVLDAALELRREGGAARRGKA